MEIILISSNAKYYPDFHDNRDMKTFNTKLIAPFIITLLLTGCMPDSLTKFKKDAPKKAASTTTVGGVAEPTGPVVDNTGAIANFTAPTYFFMGVKNKKYSFASSITTSISDINPNIDGSISTNTAGIFLLGCSVVTTGNAQTVALPAGLLLKSSTCSISGNPSVNKSVVTAFCSNPAYTSQTSCETAALIWNSGTSTCSNTDFQYNTSASCTAGTNKWFGVGSQIPYKIELRYRDALGNTYKIYATIEIGTYAINAKLIYNQSDKLLLPVASSPLLDAITPVRTLPSITASTYSNTNIIAAANGTLGVANFVDSSQFTIGVRRLIKMTLADASTFAAGKYITTSGSVKIGKVFKKDTSNTNVIYVENISDGEIYFTKTDAIDNVYPFTSVKTTITAIDETSQFSFGIAPTMDNDRQFYQSKFTMTSPPINAYLINSLTAIKPIAPISLIKPDNGTIFTVTPKLPAGLTMNPQTGVITGKFLAPLTTTAYAITASNPVDSQTTSMRISASNAPADLSLSAKQIITVSTTAFFTEGETLFQQIVPPMASAPVGKILKIFSNQHQMSVDTSEGSFLAGASLDSGTSAFYSEKAYIIPDKSCVNNNYSSQDACELAGSVWSTGPVYYNLGLKLSNTSTNFSLGSCSAPLFLTQDTCEEPREIWDESAGVDANGDGVVDGQCTNLIYTTQNTCEEPNGVWGPSYVTTVVGTNVGAQAIISGIYKNVSNDTLYVRHLTQAATGVASAKTFYQGDTLSGASGLTIVEIDSSTIKMGLTNATNFLVGKDVTSTASPAFTATQAGGYTYNKVDGVAPAATISVSDISHAPGVNLFRKDDRLYNDEFTNTAGITLQNINSVTHDIHIIAEARKPLSLNTSISTTNVIYSIVPALPAGLNLNTKTGKISGTPTTITAKKDFLLSATNFTGQTTHTFSLEVRDYLTLKEISGAPSFLMHKVGDTQVDRKCRINGSDIINNVGGLDIRCNLEAEEEDLNFNAIKLQALVGAGVCQYITYQPYYLWSHRPSLSINTSIAYPVIAAVRSGCNTTTVGTIPKPFQCDGNYSTVANPNAPNCDEGHLQYNNEVWALDTSPSPVCVQVSTTPVFVECGGKKINCIAGPVKDLFSDAELTSGSRSKIYQSPNGFNQTWSLTAPIDHGDRSNMRVANFTKVNLCTASNADVNTWASVAAGTSELTAPFGKTSPYYVVNCLNAASQIKARIRLIVRDWDRNFKINNGIDLINPGGSFMDNSSADSFDYPYNNHDDWDNDYTDLGSCDNPSFSTEYSCVSNAGTWTPAGANYTGGSCGVKGAGVQYPFPKSKL
ncbi:MAG: putative Ig domain-containing protein [Bacteroidia bacterium]|nr:putative Ig domain-containing protein [Bacteroidia bacterium]